MGATNHSAFDSNSLLSIVRILNVDRSDEARPWCPKMFLGIGIDPNRARVSIL
jgi:hypothetical protein